MLVLSAKEKESIVIDNGAIEVFVVEIRGDKVRLGFEADKSISIHRRKIQDAIDDAATQHRITPSDFITFDSSTKTVVQPMAT